MSFEPSDDSGHESTFDGAKIASVESFGLRRNALSPIETLTQSISTIAPSTSPTLTLPLVFLLAGEGTAIAYVIAMLLMVLVGLCIAEFARESSSPGSLYAYTRASLPPVFSAITAWALFFAYITTGSAVVSGFVVYSYICLAPFPAVAAHLPALALLTVASIGAGWVAYREVKISARLMLYIEVISVVLIAVVVATLLWKHGLHFDHSQLAVHRLSRRGIGLGIMLSIFSFVGFESATTLGAEAQNPLQTIPRAVVRSAILAGIFFVVCAYGEVLAFHASPTSLGDSLAPLHLLSDQAGLHIFGPLIDIGVLVSMFAATLSCVIAASRVLLLMAHDGLAPKGLAKTSAAHETPGVASVVAAVLAFLPPAALFLHGTTSVEALGWMATLTVYGFLTAYGMVAVALFAHLRQTGRLSFGKILLTGAATLGMLAAMLSNFYPVPPSPLRYFPYLYAAYLAAALGWFAINNRRKEA